jgi:Flp pilus assembly protein TadD
MLEPEHLSGAQSMNRSLAKLAAALLVGSSLAGCSTVDGARTSKAVPDKSAAAAKPNTSARSMAASMDIQIRDAQNLRAKGDYAGATQILSQLMLVAPDNAAVVGEYGKNLVQQGRSKEALDFLKRGVQLQPGDWTLYSATGVAYDQTGDYANAKLAYQQALAIKPGDAGVLNNYALSRMQAKDLSGARQLMTQASATGGSDPKIARNIALLASLASTPTAAPITAKPTAPVAAKPAPTREATANPTGYHQAPAKSLGPNVVIQAVPKDPLAGPVKQATAAPRKLVPDTSNVTKPAVAAAPKAANTAASKPAVVDAKKPVAIPTVTKTADTAASKPAVADAKKPAPKAADAPTAKPAPASNTPSLRMTADAATP